MHSLVICQMSNVKSVPALMKAHTLNGPSELIWHLDGSSLCESSGW